MESRAALLAAVFAPLLAAGVAAAQAPTAATLAARVAAVETRLLVTRAELAQAAFDLGLLREASTLARNVLPTRSDHPLAKLLAKLKAIPGDAFVKTYRDAVAKDGRSFRKRIGRALEPLAAELVALADEAMIDGDAAFAEQLYGRAYTVDPDNTKALQALRKLDYDAIFNYGVLPKEQKQEARVTLRNLGGRFLQRSDLDKELDTWVDAWGLQTRHYRFVTNAPHATVFAFAQACEDLFDGWEGFMVANKQPLRDLTKPCTVFLFASRIDYESVLRLQGETPPDSDTVLGYYSRRTRVGHFYCDDAFYAGDMNLLFETFYHEGSHQLFDMRFKSAWRGRANAHPLEWVEEGTCVYLESMVVRTTANSRRAEFGTAIDDDLAEAIAAIDKGQLLPIAAFAHLSSSEWDAYDEAYSHAALVTHWLLHSDGGKRSRQLFELLSAERQNGGLRKETFFDVIGMTAEQVDAALRDYAADIGKNLPRRVYAEPKNTGK